MSTRGVRVVALIALVAACADVQQLTSVLPPGSDGVRPSLQGSARHRALAARFNQVPVFDVSTASTIQFSRTVYNTDFVAAGVGGLRNAGSSPGPQGIITLSGISGTVNRAYLYWHAVTSTTSTTLGQQVAINGSVQTGTNIGVSDANCWGEYTNSQAFVADVTPVVQAKGNGTYTLADFSGYSQVNPNGASLLVFFDDGDATNNRDIVIFDGNDSNVPSTYDAEGWAVTLSGINYSSGVTRLQLHVGDGQVWEDDDVQLNGQVIAPKYEVFQGTSVPSGNGATNLNGNLWDILTLDITSHMGAGANQLEVATGLWDDCLSLVVVVIDLPAGAAPPPDDPPPDDPPPPPTGEGCTAIWWRNNTGQWVDAELSTSQLVGSVFTNADKRLAKLTLRDALFLRDGGGPNGAKQTLLREAIGALLNANSTNVAYPRFGTSVAQSTNTMLLSKDRQSILELAGGFARDNALGCPYSL